MKDLVRKLYRGDQTAIEKLYADKSGQSIAFERMETQTNAMKTGIPPEYHERLEQYEKSMLNLLDTACEEEFLAGYRFGVNLLLAAWPEAKE